MRSQHHLRHALITILVGLTLTVSGGCSSALQSHISRSPAVRESSVQVNLHGEALTLHLASSPGPLAPATPLVLYASGDGGWFGAAVGMFRTIAGAGHPTVGFSTKALMQIEQRWSKPLRVAHLAEAYEQIVDAARAHLQLPADTPVVLAGWSRGAALGVLVASHHPVDAQVVGLVAIGLAANEALDVNGDNDGDTGEEAAPAVNTAGQHGRSIAMYPRLARVSPRRLVVIQASGDDYLPAPRARALFGADSATGRLLAIEARNHRFDGGEANFAAALVEALTWVSTGGNATSPDAPEVRALNHEATLTLRAVIAADGRRAFSFNGQTVPPVIRLSPGDLLAITYINELPPLPQDPPPVPPRMNMTNLHFHGLGVSPHAPQDDVLRMMAMPGETLHYAVAIPREQPPGLYWYHTHPHGESHQQVLDGMSGAIVIEGIERYVPEVRTLRERVLVMRGRDLEHDSQSASLRRQVAMSGAGCGAEAETPERVLTINGAVRPAIPIAPGERQFWRLVNASADSYADVQLDGQMLQIVAFDGVPLAYADPQRPPRQMDHVLLSPAGRIEFIVTGPPAGGAALRTRCVDTGPDGDPSPSAILADLVAGPRVSPAARGADAPAPVHTPVDVAALQKSPPEFVVTFTEDEHGFYINGQAFAPDAEPMVRAAVGTYQHWRIVNQTKELHPMHIHQAHFLAYQQNDLPIERPEWLDTVNVPYGGSVDVIMDFTNPVIRGLSVFHCHLLNHEDKGMMAKILFQ